MYNTIGWIKSNDYGSGILLKLYEIRNVCYNTWQSFQLGSWAPYNQCAINGINRIELVTGRGSNAFELNGQLWQPTRELSQFENSNYFAGLKIREISRQMQWNFLTNVIRYSIVSAFNYFKYLIIFIHSCNNVL